MKLSACLIVKNELATLAPCLRSIIGYVDEIVIVDTGSKDGTQYLVEAWNAAYGNNGTKFVVGEFKYKEWSFSNARNYAMSLATGDWLFTIDADDRVETKDWEQLLKFLRADTDQYGEFDLIACRIENLYGSMAIKGGSLVQPRFFRTSSKPKYVGKVHNNITFPELDRPHNAINADFTIYHIGYGMLTLEALTAKTERVVTATEKDTVENPKSAFAWYNYGNALKSRIAHVGWKNGDPEDKKSAYEAFDNAMKFATTKENHHFIGAVTLKGWMYYFDREFELADECASMAIREKKDFVDAILLKASLKADCDKLDEAEHWAKAYLIADEKLAQIGRYDSVAVQFMGHRADVYELLCAIERRRKDTVDRQRALKMN